MLAAVMPVHAADPQVDKDGKPIRQKQNAPDKTAPVAPRPNQPPAATTPRAAAPVAPQARPAAPVARPPVVTQQPVPQAQPVVRGTVFRGPQAEPGRDNRNAEQRREPDRRVGGQRRDDGERRYDGGDRRYDGDRRYGGGERRRDGDRYGRQRRFALGAGVVIIGGILGYELYRGRDRDDVFERCDRSFPEFDYDTGSFVNEDGDRELCPYLID